MSNVSFQVLQGLEFRVVEPLTAGAPRRRFGVVFAGRSARSLLASGAAIRGMQAAGLQPGGS